VQLTDENFCRFFDPKSEIKSADYSDNMGIPYSGINLSYNTTGTMSAADGDILVSLKENHDPTNKFVEAIRTGINQSFPDFGFGFRRRILFRKPLTLRCRLRLTFK